MRLGIFIDEERNPNDFECAVLTDGYGIEFRKAGGPINLIIGDWETSEMLQASNYIYLTEDLSLYLAERRIGSGGRRSCRARGKHRVGRWRIARPPAAQRFRARYQSA